MPTQFSFSPFISFSLPFRSSLPPSASSLLSATLSFLYRPSPPLYLPQSAFKPISPPQSNSFSFEAKPVFNVDDDDDDDDDFFGDEDDDDDRLNDNFAGGGGGRGRGGGRGGGGEGGRGGGGGGAIGDLISLDDPNESVNGEGLEPELVQLMDSNEDDDDIDDGANQDPYSLLAQKERWVSNGVT